VKVAWNRVSALMIRDSYSILSTYHYLNKPEIYRIKTVIYFTLRKLTHSLSTAAAIPAAQLDALKELLLLFEDMLFQEVWLLVQRVCEY
jgi:hypothetical protein